MMSALKAEWRKLLTVRSTYVITGLVVALVTFVAFYPEGWRLSQAALHDPNQLSGDVMGALNVAVFGAIVAILLMTHEYRYNTIAYSLTASKNRSLVLLSKILVISGYGILLAMLIGVLSPVMSYLGIRAHGNILAVQHLDVWNLAWRSVFYGWGYSMVGLLIAALMRSQVAAMVSLFLLPSIGESLLGLILKHNAIYLPFASLGEVIGRSDASGSSLSPTRAALVFTVYLVVGWAVAWCLFLFRDAG